MKTYFDTNIFEKWNKDYASDSYHDFFDILTKKTDIYIGVGHIEELSIALSNDSSGKYVDSNKRRERMMELLSGSKILGPYANGQKCVGVLYHKIEDCRSVIEEFDTRRDIQETAMYVAEKNKYELKSLRQQNPSAKNYTNLSPAEIWEVSEMKSLLQQFPDFYNSYDRSNLARLLSSSAYNLDLGQIILIHILTNVQQYSFSLKRDCFSEIKDVYPLLECVFEFLNLCLKKVGYNVDTSARISISASYDLQHVLTATYCDYFVTNDKKLQKRANALYTYTGANTKCISYEEFIKLL